jgi:hypothetical protein
MATLKFDAVLKAARSLEFSSPRRFLLPLAYVAVLGGWRIAACETSTRYNCKLW